MKYSGQSFGVFLVDAYNLAPAICDAVSVERESLTEPTNPFAAPSKQNTPVGIEMGTLVVGNGFFDTATDPLYGPSGDATGIARIVSALVNGNVIGLPFWGFAGAYTQKYKVLDKKDGITQADAIYQVSGAVESGVIVQLLQAYTASWDTKTAGAGAGPHTPVDYATDPANRAVNITSATKANPCVVTTTTPHGLTSGQKVLISANTLAGPNINSNLAVTVTGASTFSVAVDTSASTGAGTGGSFVRTSSLGGGTGYQHCTAFAITSFIGKVMHSPDDTTYAAAITFTSLTAIGKERLTCAGTIDRYLSFNGANTGAGSITVFSGFCRN